VRSTVLMTLAAATVGVSVGGALATATTQRDVSHPSPASTVVSVPTTVALPTTTAAEWPPATVPVAIAQPPRSSLPATSVSTAASPSPRAVIARECVDGLLWVEWDDGTRGLIGPCVDPDRVIVSTYCEYKQQPFVNVLWAVYSDGSKESLGAC